MNSQLAGWPIRATYRLVAAGVAPGFMPTYEQQCVVCGQWVAGDEAHRQVCTLCRGAVCASCEAGDLPFCSCCGAAPCPLCGGLGEDLGTGGKYLCLPCERALLEKRREARQPGPRAEEE
jgi:hypothetical protein